jgi:hypothetical protein
MFTSKWLIADGREKQVLGNDEEGALCSMPALKLT